MPDNQVVDQGDVQGLILRGYHMRYVRHFTLRITNPANARDLIQNNLYRITTAEEDNNDPVPCLNIAFTFEGLKKIGQDQRCRDIEDNPTFKAFVEGAIQRAKHVGDVGQSAPEEWRNGRGRWYFDVLLSVYAKDKGSLDEFPSLCKGSLTGFFEKWVLRIVLKALHWGKATKTTTFTSDSKTGSRSRSFPVSQFGQGTMAANPIPHRALFCWAIRANGRTIRIRHSMTNRKKTKRLMKNNLA